MDNRVPRFEQRRDGCLARGVDPDRVIPMKFGPAQPFTDEQLARANAYDDLSEPE